MTKQRLLDFVLWLFLSIAFSVVCVFCSVSTRILVSPYILAITMSLLVLFPSQYDNISSMIRTKESITIFSNKLTTLQKILIPFSIISIVLLVITYGEFSKSMISSGSWLILAITLIVAILAHLLVFISKEDLNAFLRGDTKATVNMTKKIQDAKTDANGTIFETHTNGDGA